MPSRSHDALAWVLAVAGVAVAAPGARAQSAHSGEEAQRSQAAEPLADLRALGASPSTYAATIAWRSQFRATVGYPIPLARREHWTLRLPALVQLHDEAERNVFPSRLWRGRLGLSWIWHDTLSRADAAVSGFAVEALFGHESDHATGSDVVTLEGGDTTLGTAFDTFLFTNDIGVRGALRLPLGDASLVPALTARFHFYACTRIDRTCYDEPFGGAQGFELTADAVFDGAGGRPTLGRWTWFLAVHAGYVVSTTTMVEELRLVAHGGTRVRRRDAGLIALFATGAFGSEVGMLRHEEVYQAGLGVRWAP